MGVKAYWTCGLRMGLSALSVLALAAPLGVTVGATSAFAAPTGEAGAYCKAHPLDDHPPGPLPRAVKAVEANHWRCFGGKVLVCQGGAADNACWKLDARIAPPPEPVRETCEATPNLDVVPMATVSPYASTWRCVGGKPSLIKRYPLDARGYLRATWFALDEVKPGQELYADPR